MLQRFLTALAVAAIATIASADDQPEWQSIVVRFTVQANGAMRMTEQVTVDVPPSLAFIDRTYWSTGEQQVTFDRISRVDASGTLVPLTRGSLDTANHFDVRWHGNIAWSIRDKNAAATAVTSATYVIESTVAGAVIPAWSIPPGRLSYESSSGILDPRARIRELIPLWREAAQNPRSRYLLEYQYAMPPPSTTGTAIRLELYWDDGWTPVHPITGDTIGKELEHDVYNTTNWRISHLFDYRKAGTPPAIDVRRHQLRAAAILGFPVAALLLWLLFFLREWWKRRGGNAEEIDERIIRDTIYSEDPDAIAASWAGRAPYPGIETFLRRLEHQRKLAITIEDPPPATAENEDDDSVEPVVRLRLLVPREQLTRYQRAGIDTLMPNVREVSSEEIQRREEEDFDPSDALRDELAAISAESKLEVKAPWYSRLTSFAIFAAGIWLCGREIVNLNREPIMLVVALIASSLLLQFWTAIGRGLVQRALWGTAVLLLPLAIAAAIVLLAPFATAAPAGADAAAGLSLALLGTCKAILAACATSGGSPAMQQRDALARARAWLQGQLRSETPRIQDDALPWLEALGLGSDIKRWRTRTGRSAPAVRAQEEWGTAFMK